MSSDPVEVMPWCFPGETEKDREKPVRTPDILTDILTL